MLAELGGTEGDRVLALLAILGGAGFDAVSGELEAKDGERERALLVLCCTASRAALLGRLIFNPAVQPPFSTLSFCLRLIMLTSGQKI